jgi:toxin-antitoxin system PIN domain toxin
LILVDANILVYAAMRVLPQHGTASEWLNRQLSGLSRVGLPWPSLLGFLRVVTNPRVFANPPSTQAAWERVTAWLGCETVWIPQPMNRHPEVFGRLLSLPGVRANLVHDAHLAALAIEHGLILCSSDGDFARFPGLRWQNPLAA